MLLAKRYFQPFFLVFTAAWWISGLGSYLSAAARDLWWLAGLWLLLAVLAFAFLSLASVVPSRRQAVPVQARSPPVS